MYYRLIDAEEIGEDIGRLLLRFKYYSPKKIAVFSFLIGLHFVFYNLIGNLSRR